MRTLLTIVAFAFVVPACGVDDSPGPAADVAADARPDIAPLQDGGVVRIDSGDDDTGPVTDADDDTTVTNDVGDDDVADNDTGNEDAEDALDVSSDVDDCGGLPGCPCELGSDCESEWCIATPDGDPICARTCEDNGLCQDGFRCRWQQDYAGRRAKLCLATRQILCTPCSSNSDCGTNGVCVAKADGNFCAPACGPDDACPSESTCGPVSDVDRRRVCQTPGTRCIGCTDQDNDGYIERTLCYGSDCADDNPNIHPGATEICNNADEDCDNVVNEGFDFDTDDDHCGACGQSCNVGSDIKECVEGSCEIVTCALGYRDCNNDPTDGCEIAMIGPGACGVCPGPDNIRHDAPCGTCGSGRWSCGGGTYTCEGDLGEDAYNTCGGCAALAPAPGDSCGTCGSGTVVCDGTDNSICEGDLGNDAYNACDACGTLDGSPGSGCGTCGSGVFECNEFGSVVCNGDDGAAARNECGGCAILLGAIGDTCGTCDSGVYQCNGIDNVTCAGESTEDLNACGGCEPLSDRPGTACGCNDAGVVECATENAVYCDGAPLPGPDGCPDPSCGGRLDGALGETCGETNDCCSGNCRETAPADSVCTRTCSRYASCGGGEIDMFCQLPDTGPRYCAPLDYGTPCDSGVECVDGLCIDAGPEGKTCTWQCDEQSDCAADMVCNNYGGVSACTTMGESCVENSDCRSNYCYQNPGGENYCSIPCSIATLDNDCPAGYACEAIGPGNLICRRAI